MFTETISVRENKVWLSLGVRATLRTAGQRGLVTQIEGPRNLSKTPPQSPAAVGRVETPSVESQDVSHATGPGARPCTHLPSRLRPRTARRTRALLFEEASRKQSLPAPLLSFLAGSATSRFGRAERKPPDPGRWSESRRGTVPPGASRGRAAALPAAPPRLPAEAHPAPRGIRGQLEAEVEADLRDVTCFRRAQVARVTYVGGTRDPVARAWTASCSPARDPFLRARTGVPLVPWFPRGRGKPAGPR